MAFATIPNGVDTSSSTTTGPGEVTSPARADSRAEHQQPHYTPRGYERATHAHP
jgi:hypothetical protein